MPSSNVVTTVRQRWVVANCFFLPFQPETGIHAGLYNAAPEFLELVRNLLPLDHELSYAVFWSHSSSSISAKGSLVPTGSATSALDED